jgi:hypothetical protein
LVFFGFSVHLYGNVRASNAAECATGAFGEFGVGEILFSELGRIITLGVQFVGDLDLFLGAYQDAQAAAFASLLVDFNTAFHLSAPWSVTTNK